MLGSALKFEHKFLPGNPDKKNVVITLYFHPIVDYVANMDGESSAKNIQGRMKVFLFNSDFK